MLSRIKLELARNPGFPEGSNRLGYEFNAPLDGDGHIDAAAWHRDREACSVTRFDEQLHDKHGRLIRRPGGAWAFHYEEEPDTGDDASGFKLSTHRFMPGEYVSIQEEDGELLTYRVVSVSALTPAKVTQHAAWPRGRT
jgi:hypothetical protein